MSRNSSVCATTGSPRTTERTYIIAFDQADNSDDDRDRENGVGRRQGALAGIPIVLKDNVDTRDMPTTAGSLAFEGSVPRTDAFITRNARVPNRRRMTTDLRPPDAVARQRRRARRWHAIVRRLLEGIPEPDQPWLRKRRARERDCLGERPRYRRIVRRRIRISQNKSSGHGHAREACFRRRRREVVSKRENRIGIVGRSLDSIRPVVNRIQDITRDHKVERSVIYVAQSVGASGGDVDLCGGFGNGLAVPSSAARRYC